MQEQSNRTRKLTGSERRHIRVAQGLPRYTAGEATGRRANDQRRATKRWSKYGPRLAAIKIERGCIDCGYNAHPAALDFDHLPGTVKLMGLSRLSSASWDRVLAEIAKCEVRCANCHRVRTAERRQP